MKQKKSKAQIEYERIQKNLRNRIKNISKQGYVLDESIIELSERKYKDISHQAAYHAKIKMSKLNKEMLTRTSNVKSLKTKSGYVIESKKELSEYRKAKKDEEKRKQDDEKWNKTLQKRFANLNDKNRTYLSNFYQGAAATFEGVDDMSIIKARVLKAIRFMQELTPGKQIAIINYLSRNTTEFISVIWDSKPIFDKDNAISMTQFKILEDHLVSKYGYDRPSDDVLKEDIIERNRYLIYDKTFIRYDRVEK